MCVVCDEIGSRIGKVEERTPDAVRADETPAKPVFTTGVQVTSGTGSVSMGSAAGRGKGTGRSSKCCRRDVMELRLSMSDVIV